MKTAKFVAACSALFASFSLLAQNTLPVVNIHALDPDASWTGDPGTFVIHRDGPTNSGLSVFYIIGGTASNGLDYVAIRAAVMLPAGFRTNYIVIRPINLGQTETRTVALELAPSPMSSSGYLVGSANHATVTIRPGLIGNHPPAVRILTPTNHQVFPQGVPIPVCAQADDPDDYVATVEFFAGDRSLGITTNNPLSTDPRNPFCLVWSNAPAGGYSLRALASDSRGAKTFSMPVNIFIGTAPTLPIVTVRAEDPIASEPGVLTVIDAGKFVVHRSTGTNLPLEVSFTLRGTASNGVDYVGLRNTVVIPEGAYAVPLIVNPLRDDIVEGKESVVLRLDPLPCIAIYPPPPGCYQVGIPAEAAVFIADSSVVPTNYPPGVRITSPPNGAIFLGPIDLPIFAFATDRDGKIDSVEFFAGTSSLGMGSPPSPPHNGTNWITPTNVFSIVWSNAPFGGHLLSAVATDADGLSRRSDPVRISIVQPPPPPTNWPVLVSVVARDPIAIEGTNSWVWRGLTNTTDGWMRWPTGCVSFYTNFGPKNASFVFRRQGLTNDPVTIHYRVGGSASNGVDYAKLPGSITIPAGERAAILPVVPIDDELPERGETVIVRIPPSTNIPPDYFVGRPPSAAVLIVDGDAQRLTTSLLSDRSFHLNAAGPDGAWFRVDFSNDLVQWNEICTSQVVNGSIDFIDPDAENAPARFYRAVPVLETPAD